MTSYICRGGQTLCGAKGRQAWTHDGRPAGGINKIQPFVSLFSGAKLDVAALIDYAKGDKRKLESLTQKNFLQSGRPLTFATLLGSEEADVEDVFSPELFADILNAAFALPPAHRASASALLAANKSTTRLVKEGRGPV